MPTKSALQSIANPTPGHGSRHGNAINTDGLRGLDAVARLSGVHFTSARKVMAALVVLRSMGYSPDALLNVADWPTVRVDIDECMTDKGQSERAMACDNLVIDAVRQGYTTDLEEILGARRRFLGDN